MTIPHISPLRSVVIGAGVLVAIAVTGCSSSSHSTAPTTAPTPKPAAAAPAAKADSIDYGATYLHMIKPMNTQIAKLGLWADANPTATTVPASILDPLTSAIQVGDIALVQTTWPGQAETDVRSLVSEDAKVLADLEASNTTAFLTDGNQQVLMANEVRADLGLPPATTTAS